jgi:hypothetical protein
MAKIDMLHVPYRGIAAGGLSDLMTGVVHVAFDNQPADSDKRQREAIQAFARHAGYDLVGEFYDAAVSGADPIDS